MQALSHNLAQHRALSRVPADSQQAPSQELPSSLPSASASKGPRLPLRPKPHQLKQGPVTTSHVPQQAVAPLPQGAEPMAKKRPSLHSSTPTGQENSLQHWQTHTPRSIQASPPTSPSQALTATHEAGAAARSLTWYNQHLPLSAQQETAEAGTAHGSVSRGFNALANPGQLAVGLQQAVLGQSQAASDVVAEQNDPPLPVSYSKRSHTHLGESYCAAVPLSFGQATGGCCCCCCCSCCSKGCSRGANTPLLQTCSSPAQAE